MLKKIIIFLVFVIAASSLGAYYHLNLSASLASEEIEEIDKDGFGNSLFVNEDNVVKVSYVLDNGKLIFAKKESNKWQKEIVAGDAFSGHETSIASANDDTISILYINKKNQLKLATKKDGKWNFETIFNNAALSCSLVFDDKKNPHVSFWSPENGLSYAKREREKWQLEVLDFGKVGWWNDISLDTKQIPHISYFDFQNRGLLYLTLENGKWEKETVDFGKDVGRWNSITSDKNNNVFISYIDSDSDTLKIAEKTNGGWLIEKIDDSQAIGEKTNIFLDGNDNPVVAYSGLSDNTFRVARRLANNWSISIVDKSLSLSRKNIKGDIGGGSSLFVDVKGNIYFLWQDLAGGKLKYTKRKF